jgi:hypothetical protein
MDDKYITSGDHLTLHLGQDADVYVCYDKRGTPPSWLDGTWTLTAEAVSTTDGASSPMQVFAKAVPAGYLSLGGNHAGGDTGARANYFLVVQPAGAAKAVATSDPMAAFAAVTFVEGPMPAGAWIHELDVDEDGVMDPDGEGDGMIDVLEPGYALDPQMVDTDADGAPDESALLADGETAWEAQMDTLGIDTTGGSAAVGGGGSGGGGGCFVSSAAGAGTGWLLIALMTLGTTWPFLARARRRGGR